MTDKPFVELRAVGVHGLDFYPEDPTRDVAIGLMIDGQTDVMLRMTPAVFALLQATFAKLSAAEARRTIQ